MDEVALVATDQQKFQKSIKGIKKLLKSGKIKPRTDQDAKRSRKLARGKPEKKPQREKGLVYISHIPHGFYENEMTQYFRQFGVVTNVRVLRSPRTGRSKGAAFVEFLEPTVAEIVADTMNNYLMGKRLLKAVLIPPEKQKAIALRKNWNTFENPSSEHRRQVKKQHNENGTDRDDIKLARKQIKNWLQTKRKLQEMGIDYSFFQPVEVPAELLPLMESVPDKQLQQTQDKKAQTQEKKAQTQEKKALTQDKKAQTQEKKAKKQDKPAQAQIQTKSGKAEGKNLKKKVPEISKQSKRFETPDFIKLYPKENKKSKHVEGSDDSNDEFDSDEFEMTMESDDEDDFGSDDGGSDDSDMGGSESSEEEAPPVSFVKRKNADSVVPLMKKSSVPAKKKLNKPEAVSSQNGGKRIAPPSVGPIKKQKVTASTLKQSSPPRKQKKNKGMK